jgi:hypothetical protein
MGFVEPYLILMHEEAPQRKHDLREIFNGLRWGCVVRAGAPWRLLPMIYLGKPKAGTRNRSMAILDGRTLQSSARPGHGQAMTAINGGKAVKSTWRWITLGHLLAPGHVGQQIGMRSGRASRPQASSRKRWAEWR